MSFDDIYACVCVCVCVFYGGVISLYFDQTALNVISYKTQNFIVFCHYLLRQQNVNALCHKKDSTVQWR